MNRYQTVFPRDAKWENGIQYDYTRTRAPPFDDLQMSILNLYNRDPNEYKTLLFPSGMCAISTTLQTLFYNWDNPVILYGSILYCDTPRTIKYLQSINHKAICIPFDVRDSQHLMDLINKHAENLAGIYIESCANPSGDIFDFSLIPEIKKKSKVMRFIVDNTWISPASFNPFNHGADIVVESGSKYLSGGNHICGHVTTHNDFAGSIIEYVCTFGIRLAPQICDMVRENLKDIESRITKSSKSTMQIIEGLKDNKRINIIHHPFLDTHPCHTLARRYFKYPPSTFLIHVTFPSKSQGMKWAKKLDYVKYCTSFGKSETLLDPWPLWAPSNYYDGNRENIPGMWFRISIGYETDVEKVINELNNIL